MSIRTETIIPLEVRDLSLNFTHKPNETVGDMPVLEDCAGNTSHLALRTSRESPSILGGMAPEPYSRAHSNGFRMITVTPFPNAVCT